MIIALFVTMILLVFADQIIKVWAIENLQGQGSVPFIGIGDTEILNLCYLENKGAVFGSFSGMRFMLIGVTAVMIVGCIVYLIKNYRNSKFLSWSLMFVISGGTGNLIDRIFRGGKVVDYFEVRLFEFAIFNFADCCVVVGVFMLFIYILFIDSKKQKAAKSDE